MPVEFISNGYDTTSTNPYTEGAWADAHPSIGLASYGVRSPLHWKVTAVAGQDRTVSIAAGKGYGRGITDKTVANDTIQLDTITSGSRWDLIAVRRDWTPTAGLSKFVKVNGGATAVIPGGRQANPGGIDDQPIALVQVTAGQTQPTGIIDLRTWAGDGGGLIANHDLVRTYMDAVGTRLHINGFDWVRRVGANDTPEWVRAGEPGRGIAYTPFWSGVADFGSGGALTGTYWVHGDLVTVKARAKFGEAPKSPAEKMGTATVICPLPAGLPIAGGQSFHLGAGFHVTSLGFARRLVVMAASATQASVWAPVENDPAGRIQTPGAAGYPGGQNDYFDITFQYQTTVA